MVDELLHNPKMYVLMEWIETFFAIETLLLY